ncbi:MAG: hypothetical protein HF978_12645 [Desulfobacteraceae bacterium]|nr:hypothetical protein [Desulfobacteraceae bacterium]MBC2756387.1 hypothetical protein [Desulfobacteraceae bacterium]
MAKETMTSEERLWSAIRLEKPDRVPVAPLMSTAAASTLMNLDPAKVYASAQDQLDAEIKAFDAFGGWDGVIGSPLSAEELGLYFKIRKPGVDEGVTELQTIEEENTKFEDYDTITEIGLYPYLMEHLVPRLHNISPEEGTQLTDNVQTTLLEVGMRGLVEYQERGAAPLFPVWYPHPFFQLSLTRSMVSLTEDIYYHPEVVDKAMKASMQQYIEMGIEICQATGLNMCNCTEERAGAAIYPLNVFERFWWPYAREVVDAFWSEGIVTWFHLDTNWIKNLPYFKELPKGSAIIDLDGTTDIFAAKEILRGHLCISSDVHATLLSLGTPEEVENYCKKVIDEVGGDGGLILSTGCTVPGAIKPENFRAMIETGKNYELSKK